MSQLDKYEAMLPDYVAGRLTDDQRRELERQLSENKQLQQALDTIRMMGVGLTVIDTVIGYHVDSETLVRYSDDPSTLDAGRRRKVETHLDGCEECRQELILCRTDPEEATTQVGLFSALATWLFAPRLAFRPVYAVVAAGLLLAVVGYYGYSTIDRVPSRADFRLEPTSRDVHSANNLEIDSRAAVAKLKFPIPSRQNCLYNIELSDSAGLPVFVRPNSPAMDLQEVEVPTSYFHTGRYRLRVIEVPPDAPPEVIATFDLSVSLINK